MYYKYEEVSKWSGCDVKTHQTSLKHLSQFSVVKLGSLKVLKNLYYLRNFEIIYRVSVISRRPSLPSLPKSGAGEGEREGGAVPTIKLSILVHLYEVV